MDLEEGELEDSGNEELSLESNAASYKDFSNSYRNQHSDKSSDDSDSDAGYEGAQSKRGRLTNYMQLSPIKKPFKNPLTRGNDIKEWETTSNKNDFWSKGLASARAASKSLKMKNDVWGNVLEERTLTSVIGSATTGDWKPSMDNERNVESYDYKAAARLKESLDDQKIDKDFDDDQQEDDKDNDVIEDTDTLQQASPTEVKTGYEIAQSLTDDLLDRETFGKKLYIPKPLRKRSIKDRLQLNKDNVDMSLNDIIKQNRQGSRSKGHKSIFERLGNCKKNPITIDNSREEVAEHIVNCLDEHNYELIDKVVDTVGKEISLEVLQNALKVEEEGGMMIANNTRRRSPGGVFIQLIKKHKDVTKKQINEMFYAEQRNFKRARRKKHKTKSFDKELQKMLEEKSKAKDQKSKMEEDGELEDSEEHMTKDQRLEMEEDQGLEDCEEHSEEYKASDDKKLAVKISGSEREVTTYDDLFGDGDGMDIILE